MQKTIVITGASDGIGKAAARELKRLGHNVIIVGRSPDKTKAVANELAVPHYIADFTKLSEVRTLATLIKEAYPRIDVLINNAGGLFNSYALTEDGLETTMQVNHFAHFVLTNMLIENLVAGSGAIINTSSIAHKIFSRFDINDINMQHSYSKYRAYGNAKLANILFTKELDRRYGAQGISAVAFHPGYVATNFAGSSSGLLHVMYQSPLRKILGLVTPGQGADTAVWLAASKAGVDWDSGAYYVKRKHASTSKIARDETIAQSLWQQSIKLTQL